MKESGIVSNREEVLIKCLLMERRKGGGEGRREERWEVLFQTERNGPNIQVASCLKDHSDTTFGPPQISYL